MAFRKLGKIIPPSIRALYTFVRGQEALGIRRAAASLPFSSDSNILETYNNSMLHEVGFARNKCGPCT